MRRSALSPALTACSCGTSSSPEPSRGRKSSTSSSAGERRGSPSSSTTPTPWPSWRSSARTGSRRWPRRSGSPDWSATSVKPTTAPEPHYWDDDVVSASRRWFVVRVDLLSGRGQEFDPPPGRVLLVPPASTFEQLAEAINTALGRWDLSHLSRFVLADGTSVEDAETRAESIQGVFTDGIPRTALLTERVGKLVRSGDRFTYVFDFGDDWM